MENNSVIISPKTKVLQLIEAYPQLEDVLINYVPAFSKLKNPILRKTVAKIATLQQAATIGGVKVEELINVLRKEVGQELQSFEGDSSYNMVQPEWFDTSKIKTTLDIREMLNQGEQPVNQAISEINDLHISEIYEVIAPFIPAPLIDKATSLHVQHWVKEEGVELFRVYFIKL